VLAGAFAAIFLSTGTDMAFQAAGVYPPLSEPKLFTSRLLVVAIVYRSLYGVLGSLSP
jgi:hypothetical protein